MRQPVPFGKYLLLDRISVGGMAEVFKAKSYGVEGFEKIIAIKRILPTMGEDRDFIKMFIDEAKIAGQLAHANICQIFELGRIDGSHFIAMEYIWGKDLLQIQNRLRKLKQPMPIPMACFCIAKVLEGLDYAHRKRDPLGRPLEIVHRDCSPQNVLVSYEGEVKVIDFGIAKATSRNSRTMAGVLKGKFGYMSPEQVRGLPLDRRSDIFAIGTMLYECLTSERLFQGETDFSTLEKVRNVDIQNPRAVNPAIPEQIERVILKALAKDVEERYQWCSEMLQDLQQFLMTQDVVFTAKSLSGWLKEGFVGDIDKERGLLEQYKRVGRDGLIAGLPAAEAKLDVVEHLGEAPQIQESDATQLGGPSFEDMENGIGASPEIGPAPGSPAARGGAPGARGKTQSEPDERDGDFGEEAPTEIFGEIEHGKAPPAAATPAAGRPSGIPSITGKSTPPKPPPGRPGSVSSPPPMGAAPRAATSVPPIAPPRPPAQQDVGMLATARSGQDLQVPAGGFPQQPQPPQVQHTPAPQPLPQGENARTMLGQMAPAGLPNYSQGYPQQSQQPTGLRPQTPPNGFNASYPNQSDSQPVQQPAAMFDPFTGQPIHNGSGPMAAMSSGPMSGQVPQQYPQYPQNGYGQPSQQVQSPYPQQYPSNDPNQYGGGYGSGQQNGYGQPSNGMMSTNGMGQPALEPAMPKPEGRKKSSLGRDIAIGVVIAVIVLGGFLAVKFLILDKRGSSDTTTPPVASGESKIATLKISLPADVTAELFIDDKKIGSFADKAETLVNAGKHKVRLVKGDDKCEREMTLDGGKSATVDCALLKGGTPATGSGSSTGSAGSAAGSAMTAGSGSAATAGSGSAAAGSGSAMIAKADPVKTDPVKTDPVKVDPVKVDPKKDPVKVDPKKDPVKVDPKKDPVKVDPKKDPKDKLPFEEPKKDPPVVAKDKGFLEVTSNKKAKILVDGGDSGQSTPAKLTLSPGKHKITLIVGEDKFGYTVTIAAGATQQMAKTY